MGIGQKRVVVITSAIIAFILILAMCASSGGKARNGGSTEGDPSAAAGTLPQTYHNDKDDDNDDPDYPFVYKHLSYESLGHKQEIDILEVDLLKCVGYTVKPVLSNDTLFGYELMSSMVKRTGAVAAVNAGFFSSYGEPSGLVLLDGKLLKKPTGKYPALFIDGDEARLETRAVEIALEIDGRRIKIDDINVRGTPGKVIAYTPEFGLYNRVEVPNTTLTVESDRITCIEKTGSPSRIPPDGFLITFIAPGTYPVNGIEFATGQKASLSDDISGTVDQGYECGCWIVKDGKAVIGTSDPWIGTLGNRDPRTVVGVKDRHTLVLFTVDGRQPGFSDGLTGAELALFILDYGIDNAAMLDGGASTEMITEGRIVNRPSFKGKERMLGGCIAIVPSGKRQDDG